MATTLRVNLDRPYQKIDGFGVCQGFGRARILGGSEGLPAERTREVLDLLFGAGGAAVSLLRLCIGASESDGPGTMKSIARSAPAGPDGPLEYAWDGDDCGQVWLAREAMRYGVRRIFAHPLSALPFMMDTAPGASSGVVRGMPGTSPDLGDWRRSFADYLLQYVRFYAQSGVRITDLGFANEPDLLMHYPDHRPRYPLLQLEPKQVVDFVKVLGPIAERSGLPVRLVCCSAKSWGQQAVYTAEVEADETAARHVGVHAGNGYLTPARRPLPTSRPTWVAGWDPDVDNHAADWVDAWDSNDRSDGIVLAEDVSDALTTASVNGYFYLFGASARRGTRALIWLDGDRYHVSKRFWAFAAYSRFIQPGAYRVAAEADQAADGLKAVAFRRPDGSAVVNLLNLRPGVMEVAVDLDRAPAAPAVHRWLTDNDHALTPMPIDPSADRVVLPAKSLTTLVFDWR